MEHFFGLSFCSRLVIAPSFVTQIIISGIRIVSCVSERTERHVYVLYVYLTCEYTSFGLYVIFSQLFSSCVTGGQPHNRLFDEETAYQHCCCFRIY